ncbi:MAG TPA: DEAD/DEAH box helicase [Candidatus Limnocylindrales bacterium]|nr:DEAD/DEAH box helicase [Candidatus Limnocylindrales bacterium]
MSFDRLGLSPELLRAVAQQGYTEPTPVQAEAIPLVLADRDLLAGAQTGTGKTAAFVLPMLQRLHASRPAGPRVIRALILTPTRELALQVEESVRTYGAQNPIRSTTIYGGVGFDPQVRHLRAGPEIVVATPGRLLDHVSQRTIDLSRVEILVLDEADRMLDMGFIRDIRKILGLLPARRQNLLFSATFSDDIRRLADGLLHDPAFVQVAPRNRATDLVTQVLHPVDRERKRELLSHLIRTGKIDQALVFTRTKHGANRLATQLEHDGIRATAIHGNKSQPQRVRALADFKAGRFTVLVATEVASRGLDIDALPHVVNFELPMVPEDYVHRIGRTGRAGVDGDAVSLVCIDEMRLLGDIERVLGHAIPSETIEGFEPDPRIRPEPILRGGLGGARPSGPRIGTPRPGMPRPGAPRSGAPRPGAPRHGAPARPNSDQANRPGHPAGAPWSHAAGRPVGVGHPGQPLRTGGPGSYGAPRPRPERSASGRGSGAAGGPRRPGQGIGNGQPGHPGHVPALGLRPIGRPNRGQPWPDWTRGQQRQAGPGVILPGERLARTGPRPNG